MSYYSLDGQKILAKWYSGYSCKHQTKFSILFENADYIVLKHHSHSSSCKNGAGIYSSSNCKCWAGLYRKDWMDDRDWAYHNKGILKWEGRLSLKRIKEECAAHELKIVFEDQ